MLIYTIRRLNLFVITMLILSMVGFSILRLDPESIWSQHSYWGGWFDYLQQLFSGNLGTTLSGASASAEVIAVFPATLELCFFAFLLALLLGIPLGTISGANKGGISDTAISFGTLIGFSVPVFWMAVIFITLFSLNLGWLPVSGQYNVLYEIPQVTGFALIDVLLSSHPYQSAAMEDILRHLILPTIVLSIAPMTEVILLMKASVAHEMTQNYVKAAATKGLSRSEIVRRHVMKNALPPLLPKLGLQFSTVLTLAIIVEFIFNWPGIGRWLLDAIAHQDHVAIQAGVISVATSVLLVNILTELAGAAVNPLVRKEWYANK